MMIRIPILKILALVLLVGCTKSCDKFWQDRQLGEYEDEIRKGSDMIRNSKNDREKAFGYSTRAQGTTEKARYSRVLNLISPAEYENLFNEAMRDHEQAIALASGEAELYYSRGRTNYSRAFQGNPLAPPDKSFGILAEKDFSRALETDSKHLMALDFRGITRIGLEDFDGAIADFEQERLLDSKLGGRRLADALCTRGLNFLKVNKNKEAIADFERSIATFPSRDGCSCDPYLPLEALKKSVVK